MVHELLLRRLLLLKVLFTFFCFPPGENDKNGSVRDSVVSLFVDYLLYDQRRERARCMYDYSYGP